MPEAGEEGQSQVRAPPEAGRRTGERGAGRGEALGRGGPRLYSQATGRGEAALSLQTPPQSGAASPFSLAPAHMVPLWHQTADTPLLERALGRDLFPGFLPPPCWRRSCPLLQHPGRPALRFCRFHIPTQALQACPLGSQTPAPTHSASPHNPTADLRAPHLHPHPSAFSCPLHQQPPAPV